MSIFASKDQILEKLPLDNCARTDIKLKFNEDTQMDPAIL